MRSTALCLSLLLGFTRSGVPNTWCTRSEIGLPVVDLAAPHQEVVRLLQAASASHGFMLLAGHNVSAAAVTAVEALERRLVDASPEDLVPWRRNSSTPGPGLQHHGHFGVKHSQKTLEGEYTALGRENFNFLSPEDSSRKAAGEPHYSRAAAGIWYDDVEPLCPDPALCDAFAHYYRSVERVSAALLRLFGVALTGEDEAFQAHVQRHTSTLVGAYHAAGLGGAGGRKERVTAHSDSGLLTLIHYGRSGADGLEIFDRSCGGWVRVRSDDLAPPTSGGDGGGEPRLLANIGDQLAWLSNGRFLSTPHRVVDRTPAAAPMQHRTALIFFYSAAYDAQLAPHVRSGETASFGTLLAGRHRYKYRTAPAAKREQFDRWARAAGLLDAETAPDPTWPQSCQTDSPSDDEHEGC